MSQGNLIGPLGDLVTASDIRLSNLDRVKIAVVGVMSILEPHCVESSHGTHFHFIQTFFLMPSELATS